MMDWYNFSHAQSLRTAHFIVRKRAIACVFRNMSHMNWQRKSTKRYFTTQNFKGTTIHVLLCICEKKNEVNKPIDDDKNITYGVKQNYLMSIVGLHFHFPHKTCHQLKTNKTKIRTKNSRNNSKKRTISKRSQSAEFGLNNKNLWLVRFSI